MEPIVKNAADEKQVKEADRKIKSARVVELNEIRGLLATLGNRRFLWRLLAKCGVYQSSFDPSGSKVYFNEGRRDVGLWVLGELIEADPDSYLTLMKEGRDHGERSHAG